MGDLSDDRLIRIKRSDEFGELAQGTEKLRVKIDELLSETKRGTETLKQAVEHLNATSERVAAAAKETSLNIDQISTTANTQKAETRNATEDVETTNSAINLMLDHISSEKAYVLELYCNQRNHFLFGPENPVSKKELVDWEAMTDKVRKQLTDAFAELYSKQKKEMFPIVVRIVADRNAKMGAITTAKQKLMKAYGEARQELSKTYPQELVDKCLTSRFYYASPKAYADVPAGVADKSVPLPGYGIQFWVDNRLAGELKDFSLDELSSKIMQLREENKAENFAVSLKIPSDASEGVVYDIKQVLRKGYMLKLNLTNDF